MRNMLLQLLIGSKAFREPVAAVGAQMKACLDSEKLSEEERKRKEKKKRKGQAIPVATLGCFWHLLPYLQSRKVAVGGRSITHYRESAPRRLLGAVPSSIIQASRLEKGSKLLIAI